MGAIYSIAVTVLIMCLVDYKIEKERNKGSKK